MDYRQIRYELQDNVARIQLNDPATRNALTPVMCKELLDAIDRAQGEARALLIGGTGDGFCSGANLQTEINHADPARDFGAFLETHVNPLILKLRDSELPVVTSIRGAAAGVGASIALCGDIIVAAESAFFLQAFSRIGLVTDGGAAYLLSRSVGRVRAMELMLLAERLPARQALDWGLITRVFSSDELDTESMRLAVTLASGPRALSLIRRAAWAALDNELPAQLQREREDQRLVGFTADSREGIEAFLAKRRPDFRGR